MGHHAQTGPTDAGNDAQPLIRNSADWQEQRLFRVAVRHTRLRGLRKKSQLLSFRAKRGISLRFSRKK
jgi:hypothetical protein